MRMKNKGEFLAGGRVVRNNLTQEAFDMIGAFFVGPGGPRPAQIALAGSDGVIFAARPASFVAQRPDMGLGIIISGTATFSAVDLSAPAHEVALADSMGNVLAVAPLDPPLPEGQSIIITRRDTFSEAD